MLEKKQNLKLKGAIAESGMTQKELSESSGVSTVTISKAVNCGEVNLKSAQAIAKALNTTVDELFNKGK